MFFELKNKNTRLNVVGKIRDENMKIRKLKNFLFFFIDSNDAVFEKCIRILLLKEDLFHTWDFDCFSIWKEKKGFVYLMTIYYYKINFNQ